MDVPLPGIGQWDRQLKHPNAALYARPLEI
jgi:hypothetical protein